MGSTRGGMLYLVLGTLNKFSPTFVEAWARQDASSALAWCEGNLTGSTLLELKYF